MSAALRGTHPDRSDLTSFALGKLDRAGMGRVEAHLIHCPSCCRIVADAPDDDLVRSLRRPVRDASRPA